MISNFAIKKKYIFTILFILLFKGLLEYGYLTFVHPLFEYSGFNVDVNGIKMLESYLVVILLSFLLAKLDDYDKPSKIVVYILYLNLYLPISSLYWLENHSRMYFWVISASILLLYLIISKFKPINNFQLKEGSNLAISILIGISLFVYGYLIAAGGLTRINLNLLDVYSTRQGYVNSSNTLITYLLPWQAHVINLTSLTYGLLKKRKSIIFITLFLQVFLFSMTNFKSFLFAPLVVLALHFLTKKGYKNGLLMFMSILLSIFMSSMFFLYKITGDILMLSIFLRRLFFAPSNLHFVYYEYFNQADKYMLSHSILSRVTENPYGLTPVRLIARDVYGEDFSPNVGIFADAFLNFGFFGIFIFLIILGFVLVLLDSLARPAPFILAASIMAIPSMSLVNSAMFTSFATHGILFAIFVTWLTTSLFRKKNDSIKEEGKIS
ncbi:hypothetical protein SAMN04487944_10882 [Gracilibacillus ureilyticus]|uniref:Oligosaccharide repeat unit polymerase n=1 Tax=Gracilibacillus ureilyticus TaxID=531814 RepID=A0A1H9R9W4_9BACI|nr:oligosaccharide repeat unit polymerase [Gracilibacillus ureilyticus]SER69458.1 hypothetical protein SAMN04487944_10882 [Gracilibacillus ureilyticus]